MKLPVDYTKLTIEEKGKVRREYMKIQDNKCFYCEEDLNTPPPLEIRNKTIDWRHFPENFLKYPIHLDHDHSTGMTRGAVHAYCNAVMWQYENK